MLCFQRYFSFLESSEFQLLLDSSVLTKIAYSHFLGLRERLTRELMQIRPFQSKYNINIASNVNFDAWHGAKDFANSSEFNNFLTTKDDYLEFGGEYLKEHYAGNRYFPTPAPIVTEPSQIIPDTENTIAESLTNENEQIKIEENMFIE